jgi:hypothetical protein
VLFGSWNAGGDPMSVIYIFYNHELCEVCRSPEVDGDWSEGRYVGQPVRQWWERMGMRWMVLFKHHEQWITWGCTNNSVHITPSMRVMNKSGYCVPNKPHTWIAPDKSPLHSEHSLGLYEHRNSNSCVFLFFLFHILCCKLRISHLIQKNFTNNQFSKNVIHC